MVWILLLSDVDLSTRADLIGGEALASNQSLYLLEKYVTLHLNAFRGVRAISKFD